MFKNLILKNTHFNVLNCTKLFKISYKSFTKKAQHHKIFLDPFEKFIEEIQPNTHTILKINNSLINVDIESLELSSSEVLVREESHDLESHHIFDFIVDHRDNTMIIQFKEEIHLNLQKKIDIVFKVTNTDILTIEVDNCKHLKVHNSTHFKNEDITDLKVTPNALNPLFSKIKFNIFNSNVTFEKWDHKFVNKEYNYEFNLIKTDILIKKLFCYDMNITSEKSEIVIDKLVGYRSNKQNEIQNKINIEASESNIQIKNFLNCGDLKFEGKIGEFDQSLFQNHSENNNLLTINYFSSNSFVLNTTQYDLVYLNVYDIFDNSILKSALENDLLKNSIEKNIHIKIHPMLLFGINVYQAFNKKFLSFLIFDREGFSFCPTILIEANKEFNKKELIGYELVRFHQGKYFKYVLAFLACSIFFTLFNTKEDTMENYSEFQHYKFFLRKKSEDINNKE